MRNHQSPSIPNPFIFRRIHSLMGLFLVLFLIEHLLTNSQAALFIGDDGSGFIHAVNSIKNFPYLPIIELTLIGLPFAVHIIWGIQYLWTGKQNTYGNTGKTPYLPEYPRNRAYTWQRITSWILIIGVIAHVVQMRFINYPTEVHEKTEDFYINRITTDNGIYTVADRLDVSLLTTEQVREQQEMLRDLKKNLSTETNTLKGFFKELFYTKEEIDTENKIKDRLINQHFKEKQEWIQALTGWPLQANELIAVSPDFGTAELLLVRNTFKSPLMVVLYTFFVLAATFHAFNGLWTFGITWGITVTERSQRLARYFTNSLLVLVAFMGLAAVWGTYFINLKQ